MSPPPAFFQAAPFLTTAEAARYCGFKASSAIRKAHLEGRLRPIGRRGGRGLLFVQPPKTRFAEFTSSLFERKMTTREIKSARSRERWKFSLEHMITGTDEVGSCGPFL